MIDWNYKYHVYFPILSLSIAMTKVEPLFIVRNPPKPEDIEFQKEWNPDTIQGYKDFMCILLSNSLLVVFVIILVMLYQILKTYR